MVVIVDVIVGGSLVEYRYEDGEWYRARDGHVIVYDNQNKMYRSVLGGHATRNVANVRYEDSDVTVNGDQKLGDYDGD